MKWSLARLSLAFALVSCPAIAEEPNEKAEPVPRFAFVALNVGNAATSAAFYNALLGFTEQARHDAGDSIEVGVGSPQVQRGPMILFVQKKLPHAPYQAGTKFNRIAFIVGDVDEICRKHQERTGSDACKPIDAKQVRVKIAYVKDPDGNDVELLQPYG